MILYSDDNECSELLSKNQEIILAYDDVPTYKLKRQILSLIAKKYSKETLMKVFNISEYLVISSIKHANENGAGSIVTPKPIFRDRIDSIKIETFLEFICLDNYLQDVAHGNRNLKIANNFSINMPNVVRLASHSQIIHDYFEMCKNNNLTPISESFVTTGMLHLLL